MSTHPTSPDATPQGPAPSRHARHRPDGRIQLPAGFVAGLITPPVAWALHQQASYILTSVHCPTSATWFHLLTIGLLTAASMGAVLVWRTRPEALIRPACEDRTAAGLSRFLRAFGLTTAALFGLAIVAQGLPPLIFTEPCP